jgi:hypothetical protein
MFQDFPWCYSHNSISMPGWKRAVVVAVASLCPWHHWPPDPLAAPLSTHACLSHCLGRVLLHVEQQHREEKRSIKLDDDACSTAAICAWWMPKTAWPRWSPQNTPVHLWGRPASSRVLNRQADGAASLQHRRPGSHAPPAVAIEVTAAAILTGDMAVTTSFRSVCFRLLIYYKQSSFMGVRLLLGSVSWLCELIGKKLKWHHSENNCPLVHNIDMCTLYIIKFQAWRNHRLNTIIT